MNQGIDVTAITFLNHFGCNIGDKSSCSKDPFSASIKFGFKVKLAHLSDKFMEIVKNPKYGYGKNMNPCIDCRILMLKEAMELMRMTGADFLITGEVLGQRPMSQRRDTFPVIDREAGVKGYVLRPLSAKLMKPTVPEEKGFVNRELLHDFNGRSRKPQIALARKLGLTDYAAPAPKYANSSRMEMAGSALAGIGDVNEDGSADFAIGSPGRDQNAEEDTGTVHLVLETNELATENPLDNQAPTADRSSSHSEIAQLSKR